MSEGAVAVLPLESVPPRALHRVAEDMGVTRETVARWVRYGLIAVHYINGQKYVTAAEMARFNARLAAGEFDTLRRNPRGAKPGE